MVCRNRARNCQIFGNTSNSPITASSRCANNGAIPSATMRGPPMPANTSPGRAVFSAAISLAPSTSPLSSPAMT